ncbi:MAG TPA: phosphatidylserine decarboxylase [Natronosporangium sp.]|nr:phosphatidylserine decarboxylase [Natronosporangium sp.]
MKQPVLGGPAARTLVMEMARHPGPTAGLVVGADAGDAVLTAAVDALLPEDTLTVVSPHPDAVSAQLTALGDWVASRVRVVGSVTEVDPADVVVLAEPLTGSAEAARTTLDGLAKLLKPGGVLAVAVPALLPTGGVGAAAELDRQSALYGAGSDLILRNLPPVRVHRLRWTPGDPALAERMLPVTRPSSIPLTRDLHLDSHGVAAAGITAGLAVLARLTRPRSKLWLLLAGATVPVAAFFRDPQRESPEDPTLVVAASDGKVLSVERVSDDRFSEDGRTEEYVRIAVFLSVLDVHINRAPVAGRVVDYFLEDGGFAAAMTDRGEHNASAYTVLATVHGRVAVAQRTGMIARRIVQRAPVGSLLARGERFGLIRFGSRTDVYLPADAVEPLVGPSDRVVGGVTPLARWRTTDSSGPETSPGS